MLHFTPKDVERFRRFVEVLPNGCHFWNGARSRGKGNRKWYGSFRLGQTTVRAHRFACDVVGKECPPGHDRDHICCFSLCVNPEHIEIVLKRVNQERKVERRGLTLVQSGDSLLTDAIRDDLVQTMFPPASPLHDAFAERFGLRLKRIM